MTRLLLVNPAASQAPDPDAQASLASLLGAQVVETESEEDAAARVRALPAGSTLFVCGGDGTVSAAVAALPEGAGVRLGVLPAGTGNDLARTLGLPLSPLAAAEVLVDAPARSLDLLAVSAGGQQRVGINASIGGAVVEMTAAVPDQAKRNLKHLSYLRGLGSLAKLEPAEARVTWPDGAETLSLIGAVVANGRTAGGGFPCAPIASLEDGLLDVLLIQAAPLPEILDALVCFVSGRPLDGQVVLYRPARHVTIETTLPFNLDGEALPEGARRFAARRGALEVLVGPEYVDVPT